MERQAADKLYMGSRAANKSGASAPNFTDQFKNYQIALELVIPYIVNFDIDFENRRLLFDTTGKLLEFSKLSGGEREIAFLIGQIDRFGLKNGLLLLDEPELHLNSGLVRDWITYLVEPHP